MALRIDQDDPSIWWTAYRCDWLKDECRMETAAGRDLAGRLKIPVDTLSDQVLYTGTVGAGISGDAAKRQPKYAAAARCYCVRPTLLVVVE